MDARDSRQTRPRFGVRIPLCEVLSELEGVGAQTKRIDTRYNQLLAELGPEFFILVQTPLEDIQRVGGMTLAAAIERMRLAESIAKRVRMANLEPYACLSPARSNRSTGMTHRMNRNPLAKGRRGQTADEESQSH